MALRITQNQMYTSSVFNMNQNLGNLMESNLQASSQLKINRPSDDPVGAGRVISYRASIDQLGLYKDNINAALGWLGTADSVLSSEGSVMTLLTRMKELAEQGATETYTKLNREQISMELREDFKQLINLSNTRFEGRSIFAGHKTDGPAYNLALGVTCQNPALKALTDPANQNPPIVFTATGDTAKSTVIQFTDPAGGGVTSTLSLASTFRYSNDGGKTWQNGTIQVGNPDPNDVLLECGPATLKMKNGLNAPITSVDPNNVNENNNGTWLFMRPSAVYNGDDNGVKVVTPYNNNSGVTGSVQGTFARDVAVRVDSINGSEIGYSYSLDDGSNWIQATSNDPNFRLPVNGGYLTLSGMPAVGDQFVIHPYRADINMVISDSDTITVNLVGKDIFGGLFQQPFAEDAVPVGAYEKNLFEVCGRLVGAAEYGSPDDMAKALEELKSVMQVVTSNAAVVGGRLNRLEITHASLSMRELDEKENLSATEDVDVSELMTRLSMQQIAYNSVLKSSSMIMQMSLVNFL